MTKIRKIGVPPGGSTGQVLKKSSAVDFDTEWGAGGGGGGAFTDLTDVPSSYTSQALKLVRVNAGETGLEFVDPTNSIQSVTSAATVTPNADSDDYVQITAQAEALTLANPSGTPESWQMIVIRIKDNGTARAISYGADYRAVGVTLPTTTVLSKVLYMPIVWNAQDSKWDVVGVIQQA
jgi:hypothetical protein